MSSDPADAVKFEVDGLPVGMYAQIVRSSAGWRTQFGKHGERLSSLPLASSAEAALEALTETLLQLGHHL